MTPSVAILCFGPPQRSGLSAAGVEHRFGPTDVNPLPSGNHPLMSTRMCVGRC